MVRGEVLRDRIAAGILDAAAAVLAEHGEAASMAEIADAAGVGRATLYRYFPSRDELLAALARATFDEVVERVAAARLDTVSVEEGLARLTRAFLASGAKYMALLAGNLSERKKLIDADEADRQLAEPVRSLLKRGVADGTLRDDLSPEVLLELFTALLERTLVLASKHRLGSEDATATVLSVFLRGATRPPDTS